MHIYATKHFSMYCATRSHVERDRCRAAEVSATGWRMTTSILNEPADEPGRLHRAATAVRIDALKMVHHSKLGHPGGDLSCADILVTLYLAVLKIDPRNTHWPDRDRFIMSKGHCSAALYATLCAATIVNEADLHTFMDPFSKLNGHPDRNKVPGVEANTGPHGHGLRLPWAARSRQRCRTLAGGHLCLLAMAS